MTQSAFAGLGIDPAIVAALESQQITEPVDIGQCCMAIYGQVSVDMFYKIQSIDIRDTGCASQSK